MGKIKVIVCPVEGEYEIKEIEDSLQSYYDTIDCHMIDMKLVSDDGLTIIIDDEGRLTGKKTNPHLYMGLRHMFGMGICGDYIMARVDDEGRTVSVTDSDIAQFIKVSEIDGRHKEEIMQIIEDEEEDFRNHPEKLMPRFIPIVRE